MAEKYWNGKNAEAVQLAQIGGKQSADLVAVASQRSKEGAEFSAAEVKNVCEPCHAAHRGRQPDGTFLIK